MTCLYRGVPLGGLPAALHAMHNHEQFGSSVLVAEALGPVRYCLGSTIAVPRRVFEAIGGLAALGWHLADDALLGELVADLGLEIAISRYVVDNVVGRLSWGDLWRNELRWACTNRALRPEKYAFLWVTYPLPAALINLAIAGPSKASLALLAAAAAARLALSATVRRSFGVRSAPAPWLVPLRDLLGFAVWTASFATRTVRWRSRTYSVDASGAFLPLEAPPDATVPAGA